MARSKKYSQALENVDRDKAYTIEEAVGLLKGFPALKFDQTVEITLHLGIDGRQADQILRGTVMLPHGCCPAVTAATTGVGAPARLHN